MAKMINIILSLQDRFSKPVKKASDTVNKLSEKCSRSKEEVSQFERILNNTALRIGKKIPKIATAAAAGLAGGSAALLESTKELRNDLARLETNAISAGVSLGTTKKAMQELSKFSDETDSNVEALSNLLAAGLDDKQMMRALDSLSGAAIKFSDTLKIEGIADGFEETLASGMGTGPFAELIERLGYNLDDFNKGLQVAKKNGTELEYTLDFLDKTGLSKVKETFEKTNPDLVAANQQTYAFQQRMAKLGGALQPVANRLLGINKAGAIRKNSLMDLTGKSLDALTAKLQQWDKDGTLDKIGQKIDSVFGLGAQGAKFFADNLGIIGPVAAGAVTGLTALNVVSKVAVLFGIANPPLLVIAASIAAVTTALILLRKKWDKITNAVGKGANFMQNKLNSFARLLSSVKVPAWLTDLSQKVSNLGSKFGNALNKANAFIQGTGRAETKVNAFAAAKKGREVETKINVFGVTSPGGVEKPSEHATGTPYFAGGQTMVNEGGRGETINLPSGSQIIPHDVSEKQTGGIVQNITVHLHIAGNMIGNQQYAEYIGTIIARRFKLALNNI